jgi:ankyrin repeat protein
VALRKRFDDIAFILVQAQANLNATNKLNQTARSLLVEQYHPRTMALVKSMAEIESGAPDLVTFKKVIVGADYQNLDSILNKYPSIASEDAYQSLNPLSLLVTSKNEVNGLKAAHLLLKHETSVDGPIDAEFSPLIMATLSEKKAFAELYLGHYANTERLDRDGKSALIHAIEINNSELVKLLLSYSALEKYSFRKDGKKITFSSCEVVKKTERKLKTKKEILENQKIKNSLKCQRLWLF